MAKPKKLIGTLVRVDPDNPDEVADALLSVIGSPDQRADAQARLGARAEQQDPAPTKARSADRPGRVAKPDTHE